MLAREVARLAGIPADHAEARAPDGEQVGLSADQWRRNVRGAFKVERARRDRIKGRNIVVVDDVITTGATAEACARALKRAGAARVECWRSRAVDPATFVLWLQNQIRHGRACPGHPRLCELHG